MSYDSRHAPRELPPSAIAPYIGAILRQARLKARLPQTELLSYLNENAALQAKAAGLTPLRPLFSIRTWQRIEHGQTVPDLDSWIVICRTLQLPPGATLMTAIEAYTADAGSRQVGQLPMFGGQGAA